MDYEPRAPSAPARPVALVLATVLGVLMLTGSTRPQPHGVRPLWQTPLTGADTMYLTDSTLYVNRATGNEAVLTAYDLATGTERWRAAAGELPNYPELVTSAGVVLQPTALALYRDGEVTNAFVRTTVALDDATGNRLWQTQESRVYASGDTVLMSAHDTTGRVSRLRLVRQRDGSTVWSRDLPANSGVTAAGDTVVTVDDRGRIDVLSYSDGALLRSRTVAWTPDRQDDGLTNELAVIGGALVVNRATTLRTDATVYRLDTLAESWRVPARVDDCEKVLCTAEQGGVVGRDPVTGQERWRVTGAPQAFAVGAGRLFGYLPSASGDASLLLLDAATGRSIATIGPGTLPWFGETRGPQLLLQDTVELPLRSAVIRIDRATGDQFLLGAIRYAGGGTCRAAPRYLACALDDQVFVTAVG
ncbi:outer membrane protein assembly factor BamB family protein [Micromonosporaceae bacterium Da 78-11]